MFPPCAFCRGNAAAGFAAVKREHYNTFCSNGNYGLPFYFAYRRYILCARIFGAVYCGIGSCNSYFHCNMPVSTTMRTV